MSEPRRKPPSLEGGQRQDEVDLWNMFGPGKPHHWPADAALEIGMSRNRLEYLCLKWSRARIYDYGVTCDLGWKEV